MGSRSEIRFFSFSHSQAQKQAEEDERIKAKRAQKMRRKEKKSAAKSQIGNPIKSDVETTPSRIAESDNDAVIVVSSQGDKPQAQEGEIKDLKMPKPTSNTSDIPLKNDANDEAKTVEYNERNSCDNDVASNVTTPHIRGHDEGDKSGCTNLTNTGNVSSTDTDGISASTLSNPSSAASLASRDAARIKTAKPVDKLVIRLPKNEADNPVILPTSSHRATSPTPSEETVAAVAPNNMEPTAPEVIPSAEELVQARTVNDAMNNINQPVMDPSSFRTENVVNVCFLCDDSGDDGVPFPDDSLDGIRKHIHDHIVDETSCPICEDIVDFASLDGRLKAMHYLEVHQCAPIVKCANCPETFLFSYDFVNHQCADQVI